MKIIVTEAQANFLLNEERMAQLLQESFRNSKSMEDLKRKIKKALVAGVTVATIISAINKLGLPNEEKQALCNMVNTETVVDTLFQKKVNACRDYMAFALKNQGYTLKDTDLKPETLVAASEKHNIELPFIMAVAHQESCFGATPRAKRTNSVFSVGSYDNGKNAVTYSDPNDSVEGFTDLIKTHYLNDGKTINNILTDGCFTNDNGYRYASDEKYESKIRNVRNRIIRMFPETAI